MGRFSSFAGGVASIILQLAGFGGQALGATPTLKIGVGRVFPISYRDSNGRFAGFAVDVLNEAAARERIPLEWKITTSSKDAEDALTAGRIDLMPAGMVTPKRQEMFYVSEPWWSLGTTLVSRVDHHHLTRLGINSIYTAMLAKSYPNVVLVPYPWADWSIAGACKGDVDAAIVAEGELPDILLNRPEWCSGVHLASSNASVSAQLALISRKADARIASRLRDRIDDMVWDGTLMRMAVKNPPISIGSVVDIQEHLRSRLKQRLWSWGGILAALFAAWYVWNKKRNHDQLKAVNDDLRRAHERLALKHQVARIGTYEYRVRENRFTWSPDMEALYGIDSDTHEHTLEKWQQFVHPDDLTATVAAMEAAIRNQQTILDSTFRIIRADGAVAWIHSRAKVEYDTSGQPVSMLGINMDISDIIQAEEALALTNAQLEAILDSIPEPVMVTDAAGSLQRTNSAFRNSILYDTTVDNYVGRVEAFEEDGRLIAPEDWPINRVRRGERVQCHDVVLSIDGVRSHRRFSGGPVVDQHGNITHAVVTFFDITDQKRTAQELTRSRNQLREQLQLVELSHDAIITMDAERRITGWNTGAEEMYGWTKVEALGRTVYDLLPTSSRLSAGEIDEILLYSGRWEGELSQTGHDGRRLQIDSRQVLRRDEKNRPVSIQEINRDITDRRRAEEAMRESEARYRRLFECMEEGFTLGEIICDAAGQPMDWRYLEINPAQAAMLRFRREQIVGKTYRELFPAAAWQRWVSSFGQVALTGNRADFDEYGGGTSRHYHAVAYCPEPGRFAAIQTDVTDRKRAEERLRAAQKLESIAVLAGGVAHDFNNLLTVIMGSASYAVSQCPSCAHSHGVLDAARQAAYLTKQLLAYAGKGQFVSKVFDVADLISQSQQLLLASVPKRLHMGFNLPRGLPPLEADPSQIEQVLLNLVINAAEAIPPQTDGRIEITASACEVTAEMARQQEPAFAVAAGPHVCLEVKDNGSGMDEVTRARIFDPFFSTKFTGRGLGLAAVHGIVRSSKGYIEVRTASGAGTSFRVFLPASGRNLPAISRDKPPAPPDAGSGVSSTILIVDDEEMIRKLACLVLRRHGYQVVEAPDGKAALQLLSQCSALPAMVLLDLAMPEMGGDELVPILRQRYPNLKIVVSSGYSEEDARKGFPYEVVTGFLQKPYTDVALVAKVKEILAARPHSRLIEFPRTG